MAKNKYNIEISMSSSEDAVSEKPNTLKIVKIQFEGKSISINLEEEMRINDKNLTESMLKHCADYGWWISILCATKRELKSRRRELEDKTSGLDQEARSVLKEQGIKVTETAVRAYLVQDPRASETREEIESLENIVDFLENVLRAYDHKRDMLKEINKIQCAERFNEKTI